MYVVCLCLVAVAVGCMRCIRSCPPTFTPLQFEQFGSHAMLCIRSTDWQLHPQRRILFFFKNPWSWGVQVGMPGGGTTAAGNNGSFGGFCSTPLSPAYAGFDGASVGTCCMCHWPTSTGQRVHSELRTPAGTGRCPAYGLFVAWFAGLPESPRLASLAMLLSY